MPDVTVLRKTYKRGRGPQRIRALVWVHIEGEQTWGYDQGTGFYSTVAGQGVDIQSLFPEAMLNVKGDVVEPKVRALTDFDMNGRTLLGTYGMLDFDNLLIANYNVGGGTPYKRLFVRYYGIIAGPGWGEAPSAAPLTHGHFTVELEYTSMSGAEG
jgi:hypothetical protein